MRTFLNRKPLLRIVMFYVLFSGLWIYLSDTILGQVVDNPRILMRISIFKGFFFILITAAILAHLIERYTRNMKRDLAERIKAEKEASFFKNLIAYMGDPVYVLDPTDGGRMVYVNQAAGMHFGKTNEEMLAMRIPDWDPEFDVTTLDGLLQELKLGKAIRFETRHRIASGACVQVEVTGNYLVHDGKELIAGYFHDIGRRKRMESSLLESEARFRSLSQEFQALLNYIPDGLTLLSPDLRILWANAVSAHVSGLEAEKMIGRHCYQMRHGSDLPCADCLVLETFSSGKPGYRIILTPEGRSVELRSVPIADESGMVVKVFEVSRDITEQKKAEAERLELERKLLHALKLESLGVLAGGIAHDFNNILTGILGNLSIIRMHLPDDSKVVERVAKCEMAARQATGLSNQLLTFSRGGEPVKKIIVLSHVIENAVPFALRGSNVAGEVQIMGDLWPVDADEAQIGQVINNLLINADQSMPHGGLVSVVASNATVAENEITSLKAGPYVCIIITDQGTGIPPEHLDRIFDPYFTTKGSGTGLGLTSVYSIVKKHGGEVLVTSQPGSGATFQVYLPASPERKNMGAVSEPLPIVSGEGFILVMDDEEAIRDMAEGMLTLLGYRVETCSSGEEVVAMYREALARGDCPDAVITDLTVPGKMGGLDAAAGILKVDHAAVLIVSSGYSNDPVLSRHRDYGFANALVKPFQVEELVTVLAQSVGKRARQ